MRKLTIIAMVAVAAAVIGIDSANAQWPTTTFRDTRMSIEIGGKVFDRPGDDSATPIVFDSVTMSTLFDSDQATDLGTNVGGEVKLNFVTPRGVETEIRTQLASWDQLAEFNGTTLASPFFPDPLNPPTTFQYGYESDYFSIELMRRRAVAPGVTCMFGPRFVSTRDEITAAGSRAFGPVDITQTNIFEATNSLIGLQGGLELNVPVAQSFYFNSFIRCGGYYNPTEFRTESSDSFTGVTTMQQIDQSTEAFLGEVGGKVHFDLIPNCLSAYAGYEATWIDGIALAPANVGNLGPAVITQNTSFWHAITFGAHMNY